MDYCSYLLDRRTGLGEENGNAFEDSRCWVTRRGKLFVDPNPTTRRVQYGKVSKGAADIDAEFAKSFSYRLAISTLSARRSLDVVCKAIHELLT